MRMKEILIVSFSGGRTSAYMSKWLINARSEQYDLHFVFANTGLEHEETLKFVNRCDKEWNLNLTWIEAVTHKQLGKGPTYKTVTFETAARNGEPYKLLASIEGIPGPERPICTDRLKTVILTKFRNNISKSALSAIGIRIDEVDRMNPSYERLRLVYPLISMKPTKKPEIINWFKDNSFDLEIPEHLGNCVTCWKKSDRKLMTIAKHSSEYFIPFQLIESKYSDILSKKDGPVDGTERKIFRGHRNCQDIIEASKKGFNEWKEIHYEEQLDFEFDMCGSESCEAF